MRIGVDVDMENVNEVAPEPVPPGRYPVVVTEPPEIVDSQKGSQGVQLIFKISDGEFAGRKLRDTLWLSDRAAWRLKRFLKAAKVPWNVSGGRTDFDTEDCINAALEIEVSHEAYQDQRDLDESGQPKTKRAARVRDYVLEA